MMFRREASPLPWEAQMDFVVGEFARKRGAELPNRLVSSAKSWLCHSGVDRIGGHPSLGQPAGRPAHLAGGGFGGVPAASARCLEPPDGRARSGSPL